MVPNNSKIVQAVVDEQYAEMRLDRWLATLDFISSRSRAQQLIDLGLVTLNGRKLKASFKVPAHAAIDITLPAPIPLALQPLEAPLDIPFEDKDLLVVNKPSGLVVHPSVGHQQDTLVNILLHHTRDLAMGFADHRPGIVHRIDRDTSGILVIAKNDFTHHDLAKQFKEKSVHRIYWAIIAGKLLREKGTVRSNLARHPQDRKRFASSKTAAGKTAITHYKKLQVHGDKTWVECKLETGRTHQIRVHMAELGHPILGDPIYGGKFKKSAPRLMLHACELGFTHPRTGEKLNFTAPWPDPARDFLVKAGFEYA